MSEQEDDQDEGEGLDLEKIVSWIVFPSALIVFIFGLIWKFHKDAPEFVPVVFTISCVIFLLSVLVGDYLRGGMRIKYGVRIGEEELNPKKIVSWICLSCLFICILLVVIWAPISDGPKIVNVLFTISGIVLLLSGVTYLYLYSGVKIFVYAFLIFFVIDEQQARINCGPSLNKNGLAGVFWSGGSFPIEGDCRVIDLYPPLTLRFTEPILIKLGLIP